MVRTRIAPSPTGYPHIGTIYQALFDYAFAKKNHGQFIVRIEDTDRSRFVEDAEKKIFDSLDWFGLQEDESPRKGGEYSPYRQSERLDIYKKYALKLVEKGDAYYCFCTKERLDEVRKQIMAEKKPPMYDKHCRNLSKEEVEKNLQKKEPYVIRMKIPADKKIIVKDEVRGEISFDSNLIDDQVIIKSDGFPTYHLAVVVDDRLMKITHIVRGEEWIPSTPKHILLCNYLGWEMLPVYHTPVLRNPDKSKLSKRHSHTSVDWYKNEGFLPEAILNFLALQGWTHPEEKEIFTLSEFIKLFDLKDIRPVAPTFDLKKLEWMNGYYIRVMKPETLNIKLLEFIGPDYPKDIVEKTTPLIQERIKKLSDYVPLCEFFFKRPERLEVDLSKYKEVLVKVGEVLEKVEDWKADKIGKAMQNVAKDTGMKNSEFFMMVRVVVAGKKISPPLNESMEILGKEESVNRLLLQTPPQNSTGIRPVRGPL